MATEIERMVAVLEARTDKFEKAMAKAAGVANTRASQIEKRFAKANPSVSKAAATSGGALATAFIGGFGTVIGGLSLVGLIEQLRAAAEQFASIADISDRTGVGTEKIQELQYAAEMAGGTVEDFNSGLVKFSKGISEASSGSGDLAKVLNENGVALRNVNGDVRPTLDLLMDYADLVKNAKNPQDALNISTMAFGRSAGPALVVALQQGADGLRDVAREGRAFGLVIDDALIRKGAEIDDLFVRLAKNIKVNVGSALIEGIDGARRYQSAIIGLSVAIGAVGTGAALGPFIKSLSVATVGAAAATFRLNLLSAAILAAAVKMRVFALASSGLSATLALLGGPVGLGVAALAGTIAYLALRTDDAKDSADRHQASMREMDAAISQVRSSVPGAIDNLRELGAAHTESAKKALSDAQAQLEYAKSVAAISGLSGFAGKYKVGGPQDNTGELAAAVRAQEAAVAEAQKRLDDVQAKISAGESAASTPANPTRVPSTPSSGGYASNEDEFTRAIEQSRKRTESLQLEATQLGKSTFEQEKARAELELTTAAKQAHLGLSDSLRAKIEAEAQAYAAASVALEEAQAAQHRWLDLQQQVGDLGVDSIQGLIEGTKSLNDALNSSISLITQMVLKAALLGQGPLAGIFGGSAATGNSVGGLVGALFGGFRAAGGPVANGKSYVVGEKGPEVFTPGTSGTITPNSAVAAGGGGRVTMQMSINLAGANGDAAIARAAHQAAMAGAAAALKATPSVSLKAVSDNQKRRG